MKNSMLGNDFVINENYCNQQCEYCLTGQSNLKDSHKDKLIFKPPKRDEYKSGTSLYKNLHTIIDRIADAFSPPFLKLSGGEIFMIKGIIEFIEAVAPQYGVVVVQTNGVIVKEEHLNRLKQVGNVVLQVSLDSHLHSGNSYRIADEHLHKKTIEQISMILQSGLPVEIYSVLTDRNVSLMEEFAAWLMEFEGEQLYFPFPIRGPAMERFHVKKDQIGYIERFLDQMDRFTPILPPEDYFRHLLSFFKKGERTMQCHLPRLVLSTFNDGILTPCPNIWFTNMGNVLEEDCTATTSKVGNTGLYEALLSTRPRLDACKKCYSPWDLLSLYFNSEITIDELCISPTYAPASVRRFLIEKKERLDDNRSM